MPNLWMDFILKKRSNVEQSTGSLDSLNVSIDVIKVSFHESKCKFKYWFNCEQIIVHSLISMWYIHNNFVLQFVVFELP